MVLDNEVRHKLFEPLLECGPFYHISSRVHDSVAEDHLRVHRKSQGNPIEFVSSLVVGVYQSEIPIGHTYNAGKQFSSQTLAQFIYANVFLGGVDIPKDESEERKRKKPFLRWCSA